MFRFANLNPQGTTAAKTFTSRQKESVLLVLLPPEPVYQEPGIGRKGGGCLLQADRALRNQPSGPSCLHEFFRLSAPGLGIDPDGSPFDFGPHPRKKTFRPGFLPTMAA